MIEDKVKLKKKLLSNLLTSKEAQVMGDTETNCRDAGCDSEDGSA